MADSRLARLIYEASLSTPEGIENDALTELIPGHPLEDIVNTVNALLGEGKLEIKTRGSRLFYQGVAADELALLGGMDSEDRLIFKQIQSAGGEGIWVRTLGQRTNLPAAVVNRTIKLLEQRALIKAVRSLKHPRRKMYMLAQATPSAEFSGGPWYTDHEMDTDFIDQLAHQCYQFIFAFSYPRHSPGSVFSANHAAYPTASSIRQFITDNGISNVDLAIADIEQLLRMLVYDGKIERVSPSFDLGLGSGAALAAGQGEWMYRALRPTERDSPFADIPCGTCPVATRCSSSGDITPGTCKYLSAWLSF